MPKFASGSMSRMSVMEPVNSGAASSNDTMASTESVISPTGSWADNPGSAVARANIAFA